MPIKIFRPGLNQYLELVACQHGHLGVRVILTYCSLSDELIKYTLDDHYFDIFSARMCHGHLLPCNSASVCMSKDDAARVFALRDFEYKYSPNFLAGAFVI
jgi:hypothetical protein